MHQDFDLFSVKLRLTNTFRRPIACFIIELSHVRRGKGRVKYYGIARISKVLR